MKEQIHPYSFFSPRKDNRGTAEAPSATRPLSCLSLGAFEYLRSWVKAVFVHWIWSVVSRWWGIMMGNQFPPLSATCKACNQRVRPKTLNQGRKMGFHFKETSGLNSTHCVWLSLTLNEILQSFMIFYHRECFSGVIFATGHQERKWPMIPFIYFNIYFEGDGRGKKSFSYQMSPFTLCISKWKGMETNFRER